MPGEGAGSQYTLAQICVCYDALIAALNRPLSRPYCVHQTLPSSPLPYSLSLLSLSLSPSLRSSSLPWPLTLLPFPPTLHPPRVQLWDFELSTVKPVVTHKAGVRLSCLLFSTNSPVVVCGGDNGVISVFRTHNIEREYDTAEEQLGRLDETIRANVMKRQPGQTA